LSKAAFRDRCTQHFDRRFPLLMLMIDIHTIGGGSIAYLDQGGAFRVEPRSAGAVPGPAAYGRGAKSQP
jgi:N-methylhydantoinase A